MTTADQAGTAAERVLARIDALQEQGYELLAQLVAINSVNPRFPGVRREDVIGGETRCNELLRERFQQAGCEGHWVAPDPERKNLVSLRRGQGGGRSLILNGHIDTVAPIGGWSYGDPWAPLRREGRLYGLGATDMKAGVAAMWLAAQAIHDAGVQLAGDLQVHTVVGEETMDHQLGTSACVAAGFRADAAIVAEPSSMPRPLSVCPISAGNWNMHIHVEGLATHCGNRAAAIRAGGEGEAIGVNAVEKLIKIVVALQELEQQWGISKRHPAFPPGFFSMLPSVFHGDAGVPSVGYFADRAYAGYLVWYPPQESGEAIAREIEAYVQAASALDPWLRSHPPRFEWLSNWPAANTPDEHPLVQLLLGAHQTAAREAERRSPYAFGAVSDASFLEAQGIPSVAYGPGNLRLAHARDEYVELDEVLTAARALALSILGWCGIAA